LIKIGGKLLKANKIILETGKLSPFHEMVRIIEKDNEQFGYLTEYKPGNPLMSLPYAAPFDKNNDPCTFEDIAEKAEGNKKLAMFKADVDNLGLIFTSSWGEGTENRISFSRYAQLSRHLHYFFSSYIAGFISDHPEYREKIYTVFSGGDDLCILGAWDAIMQFAADFHKEFSTFTNNNPSVTLSGGIALVSPGLPVRTIAAAAEEALEEAKGRKDEKDKNTTVKNGISVFGVTVSWKEYEESLKDGRDIFQYMGAGEDMDTGKVSSAVVYKMIDFANRADMLWRSNYRYIITRNIKPEHKDVLKFFQEFGAGPDSDYLMENSRIAVCYALYRNRKGKEE